jgi:hypothetical protein
MIRRSWIALAVASATLLSALLMASHDGSAQEDQTTASEVPTSHASRSRIGLQYAQEQGVIVKLTPTNRAIVGLGSYLVNVVTSCNDCHTYPNFAAGGIRSSTNRSSSMLPITWRATSRSDQASVARVSPRTSSMANPPGCRARTSSRG